ncbi:MAG: type IV pilin protein [Caldimonas sp.]
MRRSSGFTLIEVMVTVAIVAILSAIAIPSYTEYVLRARITEAVSLLSDMRNKMEQYFQDNRTWAPPGLTTPPCQPGTVAPVPVADNFIFTCSNLSANTYTVTATGKPGSSMSAFTYTVDQANQRATTTLPPGWVTKPNCWVLKRDGSC